MRRMAAAIAGVLAIPALFAPASAQEGEGSPELFAGLDLRPTIALTGGYDSNPEELPDGEGSPFTRLDVELRATLGEEGGTQAFVTLDGALIVLLQGEETTQHEYLAEVEIAHPVSEALRLSAGALHRGEDLTDPATDYSEAWSRVEAELGRLETDLRGSVTQYTERVDRALIVADDLEVYDYRTAAAELRAAFDAGTPFKPLLRARVTGLDYLEQRPGKPDRDALEHSAMAGLAVEMAETLLVEAGLRRTERHFEEPGAGSYSRIGPDVAVTWDPNDDFSLSASYGHFFGEPESEEVLILDTTFVQLDVTYEPNDRLRLGAGAAIYEEEEIGTGFRNLEWEAYADARWLIRERLHLLAEARVRGDDPGDPEVGAFRRTIVRAGLESAF